MMTGLEAYDALKNATSELPHGSEFTVHTLDALDLCKLTPPDLQSRGYSQEVAERVSTDLWEASLDELGNSMGLQLSKAPQAARLLNDA